MNGSISSWTLGIFVSCFLSANMAVGQTNWPQFRGADSTGVAKGEYPTEWSIDKNIRWSIKIPGRGWSSPIVWENKVFLTTVVNAGETEKPKRGLYFGGDRHGIPQTQHSWKVVCLNRDTGKVLWERDAKQGIPQQPLHIKNSYASETPVTDGERVYAYFGNEGLFCYDLDGKPLWDRSWPAHKTRLSWGTAASPVVYEGRIYIVNDNEEKSFLTCLDATTGEDIWTVDRDEKSNWSTPFIWKNSLRTEIITPGSGKTRAYDLDGKPLYEFGGASSITISMPYAQHGMLYVSSGYIGDQKRPLFAIKPGASGDISLSADQTSSEYVAWCQKQGAPYNPSTIVYGDQIYVLLDRGIVMSFDAKTGEQIYGRKRLPNGRAFTASPWAANGHIYFLNEYGKTFVVKAGRKFELERTNDLGEELAMATPALTGGRILLRTDRILFCLENPQ